MSAAERAHDAPERSAAARPTSSAAAAPAEPPPDGGIYYVDRRTGRLERERVPAEAGLRLLYGRGRLVRGFRGLLNKRPFSAVYGIWQRSRFTRGKIRGFAEGVGIDPAEAEHPLAHYRSLDDFFTRRLKPGARPFDPRPEVLCSPADARVLVFPRLEGRRLPVKGGGYRLGEILRDEALAGRFEDGAVCVLRLAPVDYHRFHFPDGGTAGPARVIHGLYESVNPHALKAHPALFCRNQREVTRIASHGFGEIVYCEVGAMCVGTIVQTYRPGPVERGQEKGCFRFGGSTIVLVFEPGRVRFEDDLVANSARGLETRLLCGTPLGRRP